MGKVLCMVLALALTACAVSGQHNKPPTPSSDSSFKLIQEVPVAKEYMVVGNMKVSGDGKIVLYIVQIAGENLEYAAMANSTRLTNQLLDLAKKMREQTGNETISLEPADYRFTMIDDLVPNYWVSQNDGGGPGCFCDRCAAERLAHGGDISVYTYGGSNYGYWWPYPNVWEVGMQYPWARDAGVTAFYVQGTALGKGSGLVDMKAYISARLAWDPSRDVHKEIRDFCDGYYGPGGKYVVEYLDWYSTYIKEHKMHMEGGWGDSERWRGWVTKVEAMDHCDALFQKALAATKENRAYYLHVRRAYLEVLWGGIMINLKPKSDLMDKDLALVPGADPEVIRAKAHLFGEIMRENKYDKWAEWHPFEAGKYPH